MIERWFRSLKTKEIYPKEYLTPRELRKALTEYINLYNREYCHQYQKVAKFVLAHGIEPFSSSEFHGFRLLLNYYRLKPVVV